MHSVTEALSLSSSASKPLVSTRPVTAPAVTAVTAAHTAAAVATTAVATDCKKNLPSVSHSVTTSKTVKEEQVL